MNAPFRDLLASYVYNPVHSPSTFDLRYPIRFNFDRRSRFGSAWISIRLCNHLSQDMCHP